MNGVRLGVAVAGLAVSAAVGAAIWPHARDAGALLSARDDPADLADLRVNSVLRNNPGLISDHIEAALATGDADLAASFVALAGEKNIALSAELTKRVDDARAEQSSTTHFAKGFATGLVTGNADDVASLSGTVAGDLFVFGDVRDVVREGKHLVMGEDTDQLVLGLAAAGLAVTAATYVSVGGAGPLRAGLTLVKDTRKAGRLSEGMIEWAGRSTREVVDQAALGFGVTVFLGIRLAAKGRTSLDEFERAVTAIPEVQLVQHVLGQFDYRLRVTARDISDFERILRRRIMTLPGVGQVEANVMLSEERRPGPL